MNRIDRISAILIQLQSKKVVRAQDIAHRFEISNRTVYRDIEALQLAGVPIIGESGIGYSLADGYRLPPVMFTKEEATSFLTAEKLVEKLTDSHTNDLFQSAMFKIKSVLKSTEKDYISGLEDHIAVIKNSYLPLTNVQSKHLQTILEAIAHHYIIFLKYNANHSQSESERKVEPIGIFFSAGYWHLIAYCQLRKDYRDFRIDRIQKLEIVGEKIGNKHPSLKVYLETIAKKDKEVTMVVIRIHHSYLRHLGDQKYFMGFVSEKVIKEEVEMTFLCSAMEGFARWYMMIGDKCRIITPKSLEARVKELAKTIYDQ